MGVFTIPLMARWVKIVIAVLCIVCVLAICIAPNLDLPVTVIKSLQTILLLLTFSLITAAFASVCLFSRSRVCRAEVRAGPELLHPPYSSLPFETGCVQRC